MKADSCVEAYRQALLAKRHDLMVGLAMPGVAPGHLSEDDQPQLNQYEALSSCLNSLGYGQLRLIQEALDRLTAGDFGSCVECDERIPQRRLKAIPWARYCVSCQERLDAALTENGSPDWARSG